MNYRILLNEAKQFVDAKVTAGAELTTDDLCEIANELMECSGVQNDTVHTMLVDDLMMYLEGEDIDA